MGWVARLCLLAVLLPLPGAAETRVLIQGETGDNGVFDPSLELDAGGVGWLAYSSVYGTVAPWGPHVETRLAKSSDAGTSWSFAQVVNPSVLATLVVPGMPDVAGVWNHETPSLAHDPGDPGAEWKLFSHRVFRKTEDPFEAEQNLPAYSWITLRSAQDPGGVWSAEVALLSSGLLPPPPYDTVQVAVNDLHPSLAGLIVYSEPGALVQGGVLYLSLTGLTAAGADRIVLIASDDHGASWRYVGTSLSNADAAALGYLSFDGSALVVERGRTFLLVTPQTPGVTHDGTLAFEFEDLSQGLLFRQAGVPVVHLQLPPRPGLPVDRRGGQADFHEAASVGILRPSLQLEDYPVFFQIFATGERLLPESLPGPGALGAVVVALLILAVARLGSR